MQKHFKGLITELDKKIAKRNERFLKGLLRIQESNKEWDKKHTN